MLHGVIRHSTCRLLLPMAPPGSPILLTVGPGHHTPAPAPIHLCYKRAVA